MKSLSNREAVLARLDELDIPYELTEHPAVYTIADMEAQGLLEQGEVCKNLFVRDSKGRQHFLVVAPEERTIDLKALAMVLDSTRLSFASAERLEKYLGVTTGAVSPFGVLNDGEHEVVVALDAGLKGNTRIGVHPNDNTATVWISWDGLKKFIRAQGNELRVVKL